MIVGKKVVLRAYEDSDFKEMLKWRNNSELMSLLAADVLPATKLDMENLIKELSRTVAVYFFA